MTTTPYILTCLSPVHIGTGIQFSKFDGAYHDKQWHLVDLDKVLEHDVDSDELARAMSERTFSWSAWLPDRKVSPFVVASYALPCPQDPEETFIREAMKTVHQQPYVPGTSLKGAIRTAVLSNLFGTDAHTFTKQFLALVTHSSQLARAVEDIAGTNRSAVFHPETHRRAVQTTLSASDTEAEAITRLLYRLLGKDISRATQGDRRQQIGASDIHGFQRNARYVGQPIEQFMLGRNPNHDLMRAVQISDSTSVNIERLAVGLIWTYTLRGNRLVEKREQGSEYKILAEWLTPDTALRLDIRLDEFLFTDAANRDLRFRGAKEQTVRQLARTCNDYAHANIIGEKAFYAMYGLDTLRDFYADLEEMLHNLPDDAFLLNIGWGGGWEVKTMGDMLRTALGPDGFTRLRQRYRLGADPRTGQMHLDAPFPKTRRIAYDGGAPRWALGWVRMDRQER
jgi:CRISPR type III-A-associated RAMP protein Csm5